MERQPGNRPAEQHPTGLESLIPMPSPGRSNNRLKIIDLRPPAQPLGRKRTTGYQHRRVARSPLGNVVRDRRSGNPPGSLDDLQHRKPLPTAQIEGMEAI